jgi:polyisoprenoid-binding protein YceI
MTTQLETARGIIRVPTGVWTVDPVHSSVEFRVKHMMISTVRGRFGEFEGMIEAAPDYHDSKVRGTVKAASIDTNEPRRDGHLRSADFFDVENHPQMAFRSTAVRTDGADWTVEGELSLKGQTKPVVLNLELNGFGPDAYGGYRAGFSAKTEINRNDFGVDIKMPMDGGGVVVSDKISVELEIEAVLRTA